MIGAGWARLKDGGASDRLGPSLAGVDTKESGGLARPPVRRHFWDSLPTEHRAVLQRPS